MRSRQVRVYVAISQANLPGRAVRRVPEAAEAAIERVHGPGEAALVLLGRHVVVRLPRRRAVVVERPVGRRVSTDDVLGAVTAVCQERGVLASRGDSTPLTDRRTGAAR